MVNRSPFLSVKANHRRNFPLNEEGFMQITISFVVYFPVSVPPLHLVFHTTCYNLMLDLFYFASARNCLNALMADFFWRQ